MARERVGETANDGLGPGMNFKTERRIPLGGDDMRFG